MPTCSSELGTLSIDCPYLASLLRRLYASCTLRRRRRAASYVLLSMAAAAAAEVTMAAAAALLFLWLAG